MDEIRTAVRTAHFTWLNYAEDGHAKEMRPNEYWSLRTFCLHHPAWRAVLHTNCVMDGPLWERAVALCPNIEISTVCLADIPPHVGHRFRVQKSDYWNMLMLSEHGGVKCDLSDTVTVRPFDALLESTPLFQSGRDRLDSNFHTGLVMCATPRNPVCGEILKWFAQPYLSTCRSTMEQRLGRLHSARKELFAPRWDYRVAYPFHYRDAPALMASGSLPPLHPLTVQYHWYTSSDSAPAASAASARLRMAMDATPDNWRTLQSPYAESVRRAMAAFPGLEA